MLDREEMVALADAAGIAVVAVDRAGMERHERLRAAVVGVGLPRALPRREVRRPPGRAQLVAVADVDAAIARARSRRELGRRGASPTTARSSGGSTARASPCPRTHHYAVARDLPRGRRSTCWSRSRSRRRSTEGQGAARARGAAAGACCRSGTSSASIPAMRALDGLVDAAALHRVPAARAVHRARHGRRRRARPDDPRPRRHARDGAVAACARSRRSASRCSRRRSTSRTHGCASRTAASRTSPRAGCRSSASGSSASSRPTPISRSTSTSAAVRICRREPIGADGSRRSPSRSARSARDALAGRDRRLRRSAVRAREHAAGDRLGRPARARGRARDPRGVETEVRAAQVARRDELTADESVAAWPRASARRAASCWSPARRPAICTAPISLRALRARVPGARGLRHRRRAPARGRHADGGRRGEVATVGVVAGRGRLRTLLARLPRARRVACATTARPLRADRLPGVQPAARAGRAAAAACRSLYYIGPQVWAVAAAAACARSRGASIGSRRRVPFEPGALRRARLRASSSSAIRCSTACGRRADATATLARARPRPESSRSCSCPGSRRERDRRTSSRACSMRCACWRRTRVASSRSALAHTLTRGDVEAAGAGEPRSPICRRRGRHATDLMAAADLALVTLRHGDARVRAARVSDGDRLPARAGLTYALGRLLVRGVRAHRHAEHRRRARRSCRELLQGDGDRRARSRPRRARSSRRPRAARRRDRGSRTCARGSAGRRRRPRGRHRRRDAARRSTRVKHLPSPAQLSPWPYVLAARRARRRVHARLQRRQGSLPFRRQVRRLRPCLKEKEPAGCPRSRWPDRRRCSRVLQGLVFASARATSDDWIGQRVDHRSAATSSPPTCRRSIRRVLQPPARGPDRVAASRPT